MKFSIQNIQILSLKKCEPDYLECQTPGIFYVFNLGDVLVKATTYTEWILHAIVVFLVVSIVVVLINAIFYNTETRKGIKILLKRISN